MREEVREFVRLEALDAITHIERWAWWAVRDCDLLADDAAAALVDAGGALVESVREVRRGVVALGECLEDLAAESTLERRSYETATVAPDVCPKRTTRAAANVGDSGDRGSFWDPRFPQP